MRWQLTNRYSRPRQLWSSNSRGGCAAALGLLNVMQTTLTNRSRAAISGGLLLVIGFFAACGRNSESFSAYELTCKKEGKPWDTERPRWVPAGIPVHTRYRVSFETQAVVQQIPELMKLNNCVVVDLGNWKCDEIAVRDGKYEAYCFDPEIPKDASVQLPMPECTVGVSSFRAKAWRLRAKLGLKVEGTLCKDIGQLFDSGKLVAR